MSVSPVMVMFVNTSDGGWLVLRQVLMQQHAPATRPKVHACMAASRHWCESWQGCLLQ